ncbi:PAS domain S-box protein [Dongia soli]|uniref:histidine kinase n=1 Tax=Dongia soli TaxID=600628 RepID=A0ABU5EFM5_9PROT|nr:PAS domain S-box protein [Dongia soli]MDY0884997.1 PAS domain S-box protein [Dongia soli]
MPQAIYATDACRRLTYFNQTAAGLWQKAPKIGDEDCLVSWRLHRLDGALLAYADSPMGQVLANGIARQGEPMVAERPDGTRQSLLVFSSPILNPSGAITGAVNILILPEEKTTMETEALLASIVASSDDAILTKDLNGIITSWNEGAQRLFGYTADETIGQPITMLIPADRQDEEPEILRRIRSGVRVDHFETIRRRKDGSLVEISLTISPVRNRFGRIIGASKIARDITERKRAEERQHLLLQEMNHRLKNVLALSAGIISMSRKYASSVDEFAEATQGRLRALAEAHSLTLQSHRSETASACTRNSLHDLAKTIVAPYNHGKGASPVEISGCDIELGPNATTAIALIVHELATNSVKYGALSVPEGRVDIQCIDNESRVKIVWRDRGGPSPVASEKRPEGFGTRLTSLTLSGLGGQLTREWHQDGLRIEISLPKERLLS